MPEKMPHDKATNGTHANAEVSTEHRGFLKGLDAVGHFDRRHVIHPYGMIDAEDGREDLPEVASALGSKLTLKDGTVVVDGLSSWWACVHGYRRKELDTALVSQAEDSMSHVMFGGLTHRPACELVARLLDVAPQHSDPERKLSKVFLCDSGSVAVEVAMKMAIQYWESRDRLEGHSGKARRDRFLTTRSGYHGDTFLPMSVSDPVNGMHHLFQGVLTQQVFASAPRCRENACTDEACKCPTLKEMETVLKADKTIAAVVLEPIFQGAGAMSFYSPAVLVGLRALCDKYEVPLILDEIATGFGRTGKLFASNHAAIVPDIMCVGKALTGGYMTMGATLVSARVAKNITTPLMHGPTFMGNPLACAVACASIDLLLSSPWQARVEKVQRLLEAGLAQIKSDFPRSVKDVRVFGAIGVVEFNDQLTQETKKEMTKVLIQNGVWLRPFSNFLYTMPPFNTPMTDDEVQLICGAMRAAVNVMESSSSAPAVAGHESKRAKIRDEDPETFV
jgi:adenosylmethionine-8-amino-7-oxononanoate aminotransferase